MKVLRGCIRSLLIEEMQSIDDLDSLAIWHTSAVSEGENKEYIALYDWQLLSDEIDWVKERISAKAVRRYPKVDDAGDKQHYEEDTLLEEFPNVFNAATVGVIIIGDGGIYPCNNAHQVKVVAAESGYGPIMYDLAMSIAPNGLFADRREVRPAARKVWDYYFENRPDIEKKMLDDYKAMYTPENDDDCQPSVRKKSYGMYGHRPGTEENHKKDSMNYSYNTDYAKQTLVSLVNVHKEKTLKKFSELPWSNNIIQSDMIWGFFKHINEKK
jgi:hypothetical protein